MLWFSRPKNTQETSAGSACVCSQSEKGICTLYFLIEIINTALYHSTGDWTKALCILSMCFTTWVDLDPGQRRN